MKFNATQEIANRIISTGRDPKRLGRWTWIRIQGKEGHTTRIATAYRPWESPGASTVFHQQARGLSKTGDHRNSIDALTQDLADAINDWKEAGGVKKAMRDNGFRKRYELLKKQTEFDAWNEEMMIEQYDQLDSDDREIRDNIERGIRKLTMGGIPW